MPKTKKRNYKVKKELKNNKLIFNKLNLASLLAVFLIPFGVYLYTLCPTISTYADAGEYPTMAFISGFGHPPGYPLFILILKLFQLLPFGNPAYQANLANAFLASSAVLIFFLLLKNLTKNSWIAFISSMILAFSKIFWKNAIVSEVFSLTSLFTISIFFIFTLWLQTKKKKFFYWFLIAAGFGLAHHQAVILIGLVPLFVWFFIAKMWRGLRIKDYLLALPLLLIGYLPYIYIFIVAHRIPLMNWDNPQTLYGLFRLVTRASYGTFVLTSLPEKVSFSSQSLGLIKLWSTSLSIIGLTLAVLGLIKAFKNSKLLFCHSLFLILIVGFFLSYYSAMPFDEFYQIQYLERFQIITSIFLTALMAFGLLMIKDLIDKLKKKVIKKSIYLLFLIIPLSLFISNYKKVNQRNNYFGQYLAEDILSNVPQDSILIFGNDATINVIFYTRHVLGQRQDVAFLIDGFLMANPDWWHQEIETHYPDIIFPKETPENPFQYLVDFLDINSLKRKIIFVENDSLPRFGVDVEDPNHFPFIGLNKIYLPEANPDPIEKQEAQIISSYDNYKNLKNQRDYPDDWAESGLIDIYTLPYISMAEKNEEKSQEYYQKALEINPNYAYAMLRLGDIYQNKGDIAKAREFWQKALETGRADTAMKQEIEENLLWEKF